MRVDFFHASCQEPPVRGELFGICDDQRGGKAYTDVLAPAQWAAAVSNPERYPVVFTAIDKCVLQDHELPGRGRCDGMLTTEKHLYLVELKDQVPPWQRHAVQQLESTIAAESAP